MLLAGKVSFKYSSDANEAQMVFMTVKLLMNVFTCHVFSTCLVEVKGDANAVINIYTAH